MPEEQRYSRPVRDVVDALRGLALDVMEQVSFTVIVERDSPAEMEIERSSWPSMLWLAHLPEETRGSARMLWQYHERLMWIFAVALDCMPATSQRPRMEALAEELLDELGRIVRPQFYSYRVGDGASEKAIEVVEQNTLPQVLSIAEGTRAQLLTENTEKLIVAAEELDRLVPQPPATTGATATAPAVREAADLGGAVNALAEAYRLAGELEGPYTALVESLPIAVVPNLEGPDRPDLPALTPKECFDWDPRERTDDQDRSLADARAGVTRLRHKLEEALGVSLGIAQAGGALNHGALPRHISPLAARRCNEALVWLGGMLPLGIIPLRAWTGFATTQKLRIFLTEKAHFCFSEIRDVAGTQQEGIRSLLEDAERRLMEERKVLAHEAAAQRLAERAVAAPAMARIDADAADHARVSRFPTPEGTKWSDIKIRFVDDNNVSIRARKKNGVYNYIQMGMADRRNGRHTRQWKLLRDFADCSGSLFWSHTNATRKNQKRREILARKLKEFFGLEDDPFTTSVDGNGWVARFELLPQ